MDSHVNNDAVLCRKVDDGNTAVVKLLIEAGADVNANNHYPLFVAKKRGYTKIIDLLVAAGAICRPEYALTPGVSFCQKGTVASGSKVSKALYMPLKESVSFGRREAVVSGSNSSPSSYRPYDDCIRS